MRSRSIAGLAIVAVIDERTDWDSCGKLRNSADVVHVKVRDQDVVDFAEARLFCRRDNAIGIAALVPRPARVNEKRFFFRSHKQRRLTAIDINEVDVQRVLRLIRGTYHW